MTYFIAVFALRGQSGTKPALSPRYAVYKEPLEINKKKFNTQRESSNSLLDIGLSGSSELMIPSDFLLACRQLPFHFSPSWSIFGPPLFQRCRFPLDPAVSLYQSHLRETFCIPPVSVSTVTEVTGLFSPLVFPSSVPPQPISLLPILQVSVKSIFPKYKSDPVCMAPP